VDDADTPTDLSRTTTGDNHLVDRIEIKIENETANENDETAERAAWMAVGSMVEIAEKYWAATEKSSLESGVHGDEEAIAVQKIVARDPSVVGRLLRKDFGCNGCEYGCEYSHDEEREREARTTTTTKRQQFFRFQDETWQGLYGLLHGILSEIVGKALIVLGDNYDEWGWITNNNDSEIEIEGHDDVNNNENDNAEQEEEGIDSHFENKVYDPEYIALAVGLLFDVPPLPSLLMTPKRRKMLEKVAHAFHSHCMRYGVITRSKSVEWPLSDARSCLLSLRLGKAGLWDIASHILTSASLDDSDDDTDENSVSYFCVNNNDDDDDDDDYDNELFIDSMIYSSTFLIDRLYSQTYIRVDEDLTELRNAIFFGRKAVKMAQERYQIFRAKQLSATRVEDKGWWTSPEEYDDPENENKGILRLQQPPPPIRSLFANDGLRYIHAQLALIKALALVGQHLGVGACTIDDLGIFPLKFLERGPSLFQLVLASGGHNAAATRCFFQEAEEQCDSFDQVFGEQWLIAKETHAYMKTKLASKGILWRHFRHLDPRREFVVLRAENLSATGELKYCMASAHSRYAPESSKSFVVQSLSDLLKAFGRVICSAFTTVEVEHDQDCPPTTALNEYTIEMLVRCAKDINKTSGFASTVGVDANDLQTPDGKSNVNPRFFLEFAYVFAIYLHGSSHPTFQNVKRLYMQYVRVFPHEFPSTSSSTTRPSLSESVEDKYNYVVKWIIDHYTSTQPQD